MMARLLKRAMRTAAAGAVLSQGAVAEAEDGFELVSGHVDGHDLIVFVDGQGTAVAVALAEDGAEILTGLAAGAALSDVQAADTAFRLTQASRSGTTILIDRMGCLSEAQKAKLRDALAI